MAVPADRYCPDGGDIQDKTAAADRPTTSRSKPGTHTERKSIPNPSSSAGLRAGVFMPDSPNRKSTIHLISRHGGRLYWPLLLMPTQPHHVIPSKEGIQGCGSPIKSGMTCKRNNPIQHGGLVGRGRARRSVLPRCRRYSRQNGGRRPPYDIPAQPWDTF